MVVNEDEVKIMKEYLILGFNYSRNRRALIALIKEKYYHTTGRNA